MSKQNEKWIQYAVLIKEKIGELIVEEIDQEELMEGDNLTEFFHALANVAPASIYNQLTGDNKNYLEFNHLANHLAFQFSNSKKKEDSTDQ